MEIKQALKVDSYPLPKMEQGVLQEFPSKHNRPCKNIMKSAINKEEEICLT